MPKEIVWTDELLTRFWGHHAQFPDSYFSFRAGRSVMATAAKYVSKDSRVLDFGCGPGFLLGHMLDAGWKAAGCEITHDAIGDYARTLTNRPGFSGLHTTAELLNKGERYDAIFLCEVIEHLDDKALDDVFVAIRSLLAPGGKLIITTPNDEDLSASMVYCPVSDVTFHRYQHMRTWTAKSLSDCLAAHRLTPTAVKAVRFSDQGEPAPLEFLRRMSCLVRKPPNLLAVAERR